MPACKVKCNLCNELVFSNVLGHHLLSKRHQSDIKTEDNMKRLTAYLSFLNGEANHGFKEGIGSPPLFKLGKHAYNLCLCCKKAFIAPESKAHDIMTLEYITNHYKQHPECKQALKTDIEKFTSKKAVGAVNSSENEQLKKEIENLKATVSRLKDDLEMNETAVEQQTEEIELYRAFIKKAFGRCEIHDMMSCLEEIVGDGTLTPFNL
jgi:glucose-6-phosphate isomerase